MSLPPSKSQVERLGRRLVAGKVPHAADIAELHRLLEEYSATLDSSVAMVRARTEISPTSRIKNTGTILEKLHRQGGSSLKSMQDLAGMRITGPVDRLEQDAVVARLVDLFEDDPRRPRVVDRRAHPSHGYRAVHVIVFPRARPVEIQVRGYGAPPAHWMSVAELDEGGSSKRDLYRAAYAVHQAVVTNALTIADFIASVEEVELIIARAGVSQSSEAATLARDRSEIAERLRTLTEFVDHARTRVAPSEGGPVTYAAAVSYFLLVYDRPAGDLLRIQRYETASSAMQARFVAENEFAQHAGVEIVALGAESEADLRRTHGRYFVGLRELVGRIA